MKVALFFDGKNFYSGYRQSVSGMRVDFPAMARWIVERVGGQMLWGAYYYTGVERGERAETESQLGLASFLEKMEMQPGYFVQRFPRHTTSFRCQHCGEANHFTEEKEVDTTMVADMLRLAAVGAFDTAVLLSGDADLTPALEGVRSLGRQAYVATWGRTGLSPRLRKAAFDHIDLLQGLTVFGLPADGVEIEPQGSPAEDLLRELWRAESKFQGGFVGLRFFLNRWESPLLDPSPEVRGRLLDLLIERGDVEVYEAPNGHEALRSRRPYSTTSVGSPVLQRSEVPE